jgi:hypothetical protein
MKRNFDSLNAACDHYMKKYGVDNKDNLLKIFDTINQSNENSNTLTTTKPKYIFLNRLVLTKKEILNKLKEDQFDLVKYELNDYEAENETTSLYNSANLKKFIDQLNKNQFIKDNHIKYLYAFKYNSLINKNYNLFKEGHLLQIDKVCNVFFC